MSEKMRRTAAGRYLYRGRAIIRTEWPGEGPRGGTRWVWELGSLDPHAGVILDGDYGYQTRAEAKAAIDAEAER